MTRMLGGDSDVKVQVHVCIEQSTWIIGFSENLSVHVYFASTSTTSDL